MSLAHWMIYGEREKLSGNVIDATTIQIADIKLLIYSTKIIYRTTYNGINLLVSRNGASFIKL
jgi:hypothetical protein